MARDPFAPVTHSAVPPWVLPVGIVLGVLFLGATATAVLLVSRTPAPQPIPAAVAAPAAAPTPASRETVAAAPEKPKPVDSAGDDKADKGETKDEGGRKHRGGGHHRGSAKVAARPAEKPADGAPKKKKAAMSQKEIDSLLGL